MSKLVKKNLDDLLLDKSIITGKEVIKRIKEQEKHQKEVKKSVEYELMNEKTK